MANPIWFNEAYYLDSKLTQLQEAGKTQFTTANQVYSAIIGAGMTPYEHFEKFSLEERTSPNAYFDAEEYLAAKAAQSGKTMDQVALGIQQAGMSLYGHFTKYGWAEDVNPSNAFDVSDYIAAKAADSGKTVEEVTAAFKANGFDPVAHFMGFGEAEGLTVPAVPADEQVDPSPNTDGGQTFTLTTGQDIFNGGSRADIIRGVAGQAVGAQDQTTLNSSDILDGGAGEDKLVVNMTGANYLGGATIKNIETIQIGSNIAAATFDYNVNQGAFEITKANKIIFDQITTGETLNVVNIVNTAEGDVIPTLSWENEAGSNAGFSNVTFRQAAISGTTTNLDVVLSNVAGGNLGVARGIETITINSAGSGTNTLNNDLVTNRDNAVAAVDLVSEGAPNLIADDSTLTKVVVTGDRGFGGAAGIVATTGNANLGLTNRAAGADGGIVAENPNTASNLISVAATVTEIDASANSGGVAMRFTPRVNNADVNVTFKGGSGGDYIEFERGAVSATGGAGADTFAFITAQAGITNSGFGSTDSIVGGEGTDTIQIGLNGVGTYTLNTSEFSNKTGVDVLDIRGANNDVRVSSQFVAAADSGVKLTIRTDKMVQTTLENTANPTGANAAENNSTSIINLTDLTLDQGIKVVGGSGSERVVTNNASLNAKTELDLGTNGGVAGRYDTVTVLDSAVIDSGDLANVKGVEALILAETVVGNSTFRVDLTEAFLLNNTAATNDVTTTIDETTFRIGSAASSSGIALGNGDTVTIDISGLLNSTRTALATSLAGRGIDVALGAATVNYVVDGAAATAAQIALVTKADANRADAGVSAAAGAVVLAPVVLAATSNITGTGADDTYQGNLAAVAAATVNGAAGNDTLQMTEAGVIGAMTANITSVEILTLANGANTVTLNAAGAFSTVNGGTGADILTMAANAASDGATVNLGAGNDTLNLVAGRTYTGSFAGGDGVDTLTPGAATVLTNATITGFDTLTLAATGAITVGANSLLNQFTSVNATATGGSETINIAAGTHDISSAVIGGFLTEAGQTTTYTIAANSSLTVGGDAQVGATAVAVFTGAGTLNSSNAITIAATDTITNVALTAGAGNVNIDATAAVLGGSRTFRDSTGNNVIDFQGSTAGASTVVTLTGGNDTVRLDADTIATANRIQINGFTNDIIDLDSATAVTATALNIAAGAGNATALVTAAAGTATNAYILQGAAAQINGALTETADGGAVELAILNLALDSGPGRANTQEAYFILDNGTDTGIYRAVFANTAGALNLANEIAVNLVGVISNVQADALLNANFS